MSDNPKEDNKTLWLATGLGISLIGAGIILVWLGTQGETEITLFGNSFKSHSVGVAGIFCGTVLTILTAGRILTTVERRRM